MRQKQSLENDLLGEIDTCIQKLQEVRETRSSSVKDLASSAINTLNNAKKKIEVVKEKASKERR